MNSKIFIFSLFIFIPLKQVAQVPEYIQQIVKSYPVSSQITVDIANKYGKIQVKNWDSDSVRFIIDLRIRAKDDPKLQKLKQTIDFEFTPGQYYLIAHTKIGDKGSDVLKDIIDIAGNYLSAANSVVINYTVMVPSDVPLKIEDKFGDVYIDDLNANFNLTLSYGDLTCNRLNAKSDIRITSGNGEVNYIKEGILYLSYGNMHIRDAGHLSAETRSSGLTIDKSSDLKLNSRRDKIVLNDMGSLSGESYFSRINGGVLRNEMNLASRYGDIAMEYIHKGFSTINITSEYTDISLGFEKPMLLNCELTHHEDVMLVYPKNYSSFKTSVVNAENKIFLTTGTLGTGNTPEGNLVINTPRKCHLTLSYRDAVQH